MTTPLSADIVVKSVKDALKKTKQKNAGIVFKAAGSEHAFKIGNVGVDDDGNIYLLEAERYSSPIGFN